jgi:ribosome maturation factor RimP
MQKDTLLEKVKDIVSDIFRDERIELVDISYRRERGRRVLRILADTENGITVDECARMNEVIGEALDAENLMEENYLLEVSSPGLDRPLKTHKDFLRIKGKKIHVHTYEAIEGKKEFVGVLEGVEDDNISLSCEQEKLTKVPLSKIAKATLDYKSLI